ncbi:hypothetical protein ACJMK2_016530 [Sinanodonta woodiana]|uniref:Ubiquitin-like domain-containing protein n=1 Tax=Sinanodonta woodiana TaxID=1069815 RepID=A0ABD3UXC6_SINWO
MKHCSHIKVSIQGLLKIRNFAQINWISLNRHKKSAILSLYDKSSTDFVLQKEWIYDKNTLRLCKVGKERIEKTHKEAGCQKSDKQPIFSNSFIQAPKLSPFEEYQQGKSKFWENVPHEKAVPVKSVFRYKKRKSACTGAKIVAVKHKKKQPRRRKRKLKVPKLNVDMSYEQFLEEIKYFSQVQHDEIHSNGQKIKQNKDPSELEVHNKGATGPSRTKIQLIFKAKSTFTLDIHDRMNISMEEIRSFVQRKDKICANMQLLLYEGHILQEDHLRHLKNGDCIHVLCRGKGGMQSGSSDQELKDDSTSLLTITDKSSDDEVQKWLVDVVHIDPAYRDKFDFVDGKSICQCQDYRELSSILSIPIGLARKVFYMRSQDSWFTNIDIGGLRRWSIDDLSVHLKDIKYKQLKEILQDKCIDGLTFLTYSFSAKEDLKLDFGLQQDGLHLRLWTESQKLKESLTVSKANNPKTDTSE